MSGLKSHGQAGVETRHTMPGVLKLGVIALVYFVTARIGLALIAQPEGLATIWLASGVALAALLLNSRRDWGAILATIFVVNALSHLAAGTAPSISIGLALAHTLEPGLGAWLMNRWLGTRITFARLADVLGLIGVATLANTLTASLGAVIPTLGLGASYWDVWAIWWIADGLGILLITPLIVIWATNGDSLRAMLQRRWIEVAAWMILWSAMAWFIFGSTGIDTRIVPRPYMLFPFLVWAALRFSPRGVTTALALLALIALGNTATGAGDFPLGGATPTERLLFVQAFLSVASVTELVLAAILTERRRAVGNLRESEGRYRTLVEQASDGIFVTDAVGHYTDVNSYGCRMLGYSREEILGLSMQELVSPEDLAKTPLRFAELLAGKTIISERQMLCKDGRLLPVEISAKMLPDGRFQDIVRDITERQRAEAALKEYSEHLEQMVEERTRELRDAQDRLLRQERLTVLGQLAGGIGHELRSPLGAIKNAVYLLNLALPAPDPDMRETLEILGRQVAACDRIITSLLDVARPQSPFRRLTDLRETLGAALAQIPIPGNVTVNQQYDSALPALAVDPAQLQIAFGNLIRNAVQAMPDGGQLTIAARETREIGRDTNSPQIAIAFSDTGAGIAPEIRDKIFQPLFSTKSRGLGLGLALCKLVVEEHNGRIEVISQVGNGTTVIIFLPVTQEVRNV